MTKPRVFSGIQPSGSIHIGNYLGAIRRWVREQVDADSLYCVVDLHAITVPQDPDTLRHNIRDLAAILFAAGLEPAKCTLFVQSHVSAHAELAWLLNCVITMGMMQRMTQFKEKSQNQRSSVSVGLFDYPALMAADILLYRTNIVPVGDDQTQHVELARDAAQRFNQRFGPVFVLPEARIASVGARVMGLDDPTRKMSKSGVGGDHAIGILDEPEVVRQKVARATTDSRAEVRFDMERPGIFNLLSIYQGFTEQSREDIESRFDGKGYAYLKRELAEVIIEILRPVRERYREIMADVSTLDRMLLTGAEAVRPIAAATLEAAMKGIGLR